MLEGNHLILELLVEGGGRLHTTIHPQSNQRLIGTLKQQQILSPVEAAHENDVTWFVP